jgi:DNA-binding winged helix-turn-helix (wHTH) protein/Tol biopolymer transport system component
MQSQRNARVLQFGAFELRTDTGEVRKHGTRVRLQGKPLQLLQALLDRPGDVVSRDELRERLWAADTFVDFESGLNTAVNRLRLALGDSADHPRYVETLARSGYRFMAPVLENHASLEYGEVFMEPPLPPLPPSKDPQSRVRRPWLWVVSAAAVLAAVSLLFIVRLPPAPPPVFHQVTFRRTAIRAARFGPDGQSVIYEGLEAPDNRELYLVNPVSPESRPLGFHGELLAAVSRSGELALLNLDSAGNRNLVRVPLNGDTPLLLDQAIWSADWAPDGSKMAVIRRMNRETLEYPRGKVVYESPGWLSDARVSPSGSQVAFISHPVLGDDGGNIEIIDSHGLRRSLSAGWASADGLAWAPSGREVWFTAARTGLTRALYAVTVSGKLRLIAASPGTLTLFDIAPSGRVLVARQQIHAMMTEVSQSDPQGRDLSWFDYSNVMDISADGKVILFEETGEGGGPHHAVYIRRAGTHGAVRLGEGYALALSPDGSWAVTLPDTDQSTLNLVPVTPGQPRVLSGHGIKYAFARFFPSGDRLLVNGTQSDGRHRLFVQLLDGSPPQPLPTTTYLMRPAISPDGKQIAGTDSEQRLVTFPVEGGEPRVIASPFAPTVLSWSPSGNTLLAQSSAIPAALVHVDFESGRYKTWKEIAPYHLAGVTHMWLAVASADERTIVFSYQQTLSELFLVDGWR